MRHLSLTARSSWLITLVFATIFIVNAATLVSHARSRFWAEMENIGHLARELVVLEIADSRDPLPRLRRLFQNLQNLRHARLQVFWSNQPFPTLITAAAQNHARDIPNWFSSLVWPEPKAILIPFTMNGMRYGNIAITSYPSDEAAQAWSDAVTLAARNLVALAVILAGILILLRRALSPFGALAQGLSRLEQGMTKVRLRPEGATEFRDISMKLNALAATLDRVREENHALLQRLIKVQDDERLQIARDLHDEAGPCLFSIRAGVLTLTSVMPPAGFDIGRVRKAGGEIGAASEALQDVIRGMLDQLRPPGLAELGLEPALRGLIANWQGVRPGVSIALETPHDLGSIDEPVKLTAYRIIQESLTNIYRHASASWAKVRLEFELASAHTDADGVDAAALVLHITIADDGVGIGERQGTGRGLLGMTERVKALDGRIAVQDRPGGGTLIDAMLPLPEEDTGD